VSTEIDDTEQDIDDELAAQEIDMLREVAAEHGACCGVQYNIELEIALLDGARLYFANKAVDFKPHESDETPTETARTN
jgi:hypothetical protein